MIELKKNRRGLALVELMIVVLGILIAAGIAVALLLKPFSPLREDLTRQRLMAIKRAIIGNSDLLVEKAQQDFGFVGDLGVLPGNLVELIEQGSYPPFQFQNNVGFGWHGPYLSIIREGASYIALVDGWGRPFSYLLGGNGLSCQISSSGADGTFSTADDIVEVIRENQAFLFIRGEFLSRVSKNLLSTYNAVLEIYYPAGSAGLQTATVNIIGGVYDTALSSLRLPIGCRFFQTTDGRFRKVAAINSSSSTENQRLINFIGDEPLSGSAEFELSFDGNDDTQNNPRTDRMGIWSVSGGALVPTGTGESRTFFSNPGVLWQNYRVEVNATLLQGRGYGIFYRADGQASVNGYCFQFEPDDYPQGVSLNVRRFIAGNVDQPIQRVVFTSNEFQARFGRPIYGVSHQISITVQGANQIIKLDGQTVLSFSDGTFPFGNVGFRSPDGNGSVRFHFIQIYPIPPLPDGEIVWYKFEEGDGLTVYGSGFEIGAEENNGQLINGVSRETDGVFGQRLRFDGQNDYVFVVDAPLFRFGQQLTLECWARPLGNNRDTLVIQKGNSNGYGLAMDRNQGWFGFVTLSTGQRYNLNWGLGRPQINQWYHLVLSYDGSELRLYVNGTLRNTMSLSGTLLTTNQPLIIGSNAGNDNFYHGSIDEVVLYNRAISSTKVTQRYQKYH